MGFVQKFVFRKRLLDQMPKSVAEINTSAMLCGLISNMAKITPQLDKELNKVQQNYVIGNSSESSSTIIHLHDRSVFIGTSDNLPANLLMLIFIY